MANDIYSCPPGGVIAAGRVLAPNIVGRQWTPARDVAGNVLDGNWAGLPINTWLDVVGQVLNDVIETPHYVNGSGGNSAHTIIDAWSGAAWDPASRSMYISGGGHGDSHCCETGVYKLDATKLQLSRVIDRQPVAQGQYWDGSAFVDGNSQAAYSIPLKNGVPSAWHTYHGLVFIPPSVMGNTKGGVHYHGSARSIIDLDTLTYSTTHWNQPVSGHDLTDWSNQAVFLDGHTLYAPLGAWYHYRFDINQTESTDWSATSRGKWLSLVSSGITCYASGSCVWGTLPERREEISFIPGGGRRRVRYGQAIDANASVWTPYFDEITLTSADGSHADFNDTTLIDNGKFAAAGVCYDHPTQTLYLVSSTVGGEVYKVTGLSGNTWTTEKLVGTGMLRTTSKGNYGRVRLADINGKKFLVRIASTTTPIEVMRTS